MNNRKLSSLAVAVGLGVVLSPAVASAQEQAGAQPGTEAPVESHEEKPNDLPSDTPQSQPGTEVPSADSTPAEKPVDSTVQPGTATHAPESDKAPEKLPENSGDTGTVQPGTQTPVAEQPDAPAHGANPGEGQSPREDAADQAPQEPVATTPEAPAEQPEPADAVEVAAPQEEAENPAQSDVTTEDEESVRAALEGVVGEESPQPAPAQPVQQSPQEPVATTPEAPAEQPEPGIAGAYFAANGYGEEFSATTQTATSGVAVNFAGQEVESSTEGGVVINGSSVASAQEVQETNAQTSELVNALPSQVKQVTGSAYDRVQDELATLPEQQDFSAAGISAELSIQHWA